MPSRTLSLTPVHILRTIGLSQALYHTLFHTIPHSRALSHTSHTSTLSHTIKHCHAIASHMSTPHHTTHFRTLSNIVTPSPHSRPQQHTLSNAITRYHAQLQLLVITRSCHHTPSPHLLPHQTRAMVTLRQSEPLLHNVLTLCSISAGAAVQQGQAAEQRRQMGIGTGQEH